MLHFNLKNLEQTMASPPTQIPQPTHGETPAQGQFDFSAPLPASAVAKRVVKVTVQPIKPLPPAIVQSAPAVKPYANNAYPSKEQLQQIIEQPFTYDLHDADFRVYWTKRTGYTWSGGNERNDDGSPKNVDITQRLLDVDENPRLGTVHHRRWYQHIWNVWIAQLAATQVAA